ncbi:MULTISPECIES: 5'-nucleotidase [unclassified Nitratiruptor]|uniref:5'-nucleotidase n=1 Tax=unclassified Nitratiruptor TaxID=2624044 RepID=UPI00191675C2|nr:MULTISPECIES: 5'-nucleotidase [unclassified Nitratiruptor]BCD59488.1 5'-nucleotidase [Nitratiruptor sp. YY08-10]BCD63412.1 5'-nucleotidase [Nitratiruptor sp. YY08-14]
MALDLSDTLVIGISATALFDLSEADKIFRTKYKENKETAIDEYRKYMLKHENDPLDDGTGMPLVKALLNLNKYSKKDEPPLVEVVVMSRNSPETGIRVFKTIRERQLPISRHAFTGGEPVTDYLEAYYVDLFLTTNEKDAQRVMDSEKCAVAIVQQPPEHINSLPENQVRIAFDGDAVLFSEKSEIVYKSKGMEEFHKNEDELQDIPMEEGPYAKFLKKLARLQDRLPFSVEYSPVRIALVTARNAPAEMRVINTLRHWGVYIDEIFFLGGLDKSRILKAFKPHIFFDDQEQHLKNASQLIPSAKVPYKSDSPLCEKNSLFSFKDKHEK